MKLKASVTKFGGEHLVITVTGVAFIEDQVRHIFGYDNAGNDYKFKHCEEPFVLWSEELHDLMRLRREEEVKRELILS